MPFSPGKATPPPSAMQMPKTPLPAVVGARWREDFCCCGYGSFSVVCMCAWTLFIALPALYFYFVGPGLTLRHGPMLLWVALGLFVATLLCFGLVSWTDPGVASKPPKLQRPGAMDNERELPEREFNYSQDSNRYVREFDHFCDFVGNDIGGGNIPYFVSFLVSIATLAAFLFTTCILYEVDLWLPPVPSREFVLNAWRVGAATVLLALVMLGSYRCTKAEACDGVLPLIMMMPGATVGAVLLVIVLAAVVLLPFVTNMWDVSTADTNPAAFFLLLPLLAFATLFWGMAAHWTWLQCKGLTQKLFLRAKGFSRKKPPAPKPQLL